MKSKRECNYFKELMTDALMGELPEKKKPGFDAHINECTGCAGEFREMTALLSTMDRRRRPEMSDAYWDAYMPHLQDKIDAVEQKSWINWFPGWVKDAVEWLRENLNMNVRWVLYPVAAAALVIIGIGIGKFLYLGGGQQLLDEAVHSVSGVNPAVAEHFDSLRPVLIDYSNYTAASQPVLQTAGQTAGQDVNSGPTIMVDKNAMQKLVLENHLLKQMVARSNDPALKQLMEEIQMVLMEIANAPDDDPQEENIKFIQQLLEQNDILLKMNVYRKNTGTPKAGSKKIHSL